MRGSRRLWPAAGGAGPAAKVQKLETSELMLFDVPEGMVGPLLGDYSTSPGGGRQ